MNLLTRWFENRRKQVAVIDERRIARAVERKRSKDAYTRAEVARLRRCHDSFLNGEAGA